MLVFACSVATDVLLSAGTSSKVPNFASEGNCFPNRFLGSKRESMRLTPAERRRSQRIHVQIPMFVRGTDAAGLEFLDLTKTLDISATGAYLASPRAVRMNQVVNLTIPAPPSPSSTMPAETPPIQARVRRHRADHGIHMIGVEFLRSLE
jgi:hypothetical protein